MPAAAAAAQGQVRAAAISRVDSSGKRRGSLCRGTRLAVNPSLCWLTKHSIDMLSGKQHHAVNSDQTTVTVGSCTEVDFQKADCTLYHDLRPRRLQLRRHTSCCNSQEKTLTVPVPLAPAYCFPVALVTSPRAKAGGKQSTKDATGKFARSAGSRLRRYNEAALSRDITALVKEWTPLLAASGLIFVAAPGSNGK